MITPTIAKPFMHGTFRMIRDLLSRYPNRAYQARIAVVVLLLLVMSVTMKFMSISPDLCRPIDDVTSPPCHESIYSFSCSNRTQSFLEDAELLGRCMVLGEMKDKNDPRLQQNDDADDAYLITKCGKSRLELLSFRETSAEQIKDTAWKVPNVVHYVSLGCSNTFNFINYVSFFSVHKFIKPWKIIVHGDCVPRGTWWKRTTLEIPNLYFSYRERPKLIQGRAPKWIEHEADILRLQILYDNGGIYLDMDVLVLKPFSPLYKHSTVLARETSIGLSNGIILTTPRSPFICVWMNSYREYSGQHWNRHSVIAPHMLAFKFPRFIHIEERSMMRPNYLEAEQKMHYGTFNWTQNYSIHIWRRIRFVHLPERPDDVRSVNTAVAETIRFILYGTKNRIRLRCRKGIRLKRTATYMKRIASLAKMTKDVGIYVDLHRIAVHQNREVYVWEVSHYLDNGGIYMDTDVLALKSFTPLLKYETTLGRQERQKLCNGIILTKPKAPFLCVWMHSYREYSTVQAWDLHSSVYSNRLARVIPDRVHIEEDRLQRPNFEEVKDKLYLGSFDWRMNYAVHLYNNAKHKYLITSPNQIRSMKNGMGEILRYILYDVPRPMS